MSVAGMMLTSLPQEGVGLLKREHRPAYIADIVTDLRHDFYDNVSRLEVCLTVKQAMLR